MSRRLVRKETVQEILPLPEADSLERARVGGWEVVVRKGEFHPGDPVLFFEVDACLPPGDGRWDFLSRTSLRTWKNPQGEVVKEVYRLKTIRLRGALSQGLILPWSLFPELEGRPEEEWASILGVELWDEVEAKYGAAGKALSGELKGPFPSFLRKTDEERIQNLLSYWKDLPDSEWEVTRKVDGSSLTAFFCPQTRPEEPFGVCSRNYELKLDSPSSWVDMALSLDLEGKLRALSSLMGGREVAIQGELHGLGMNGNRDLLPSRELWVFRIWDVSFQTYLLPSSRLALCQEVGLKHVPVLARHFRVFQECPTLASLLELAEGKTETSNREREGIVLKQEDGPLSFKVISNRYLLKEQG